MLLLCCKGGRQTSKPQSAAARAKMQGIAQTHDQFRSDALSLGITDLHSRLPGKYGAALLSTPEVSVQRFAYLNTTMHSSASSRKISTSTLFREQLLIFLLMRIISVQCYRTRQHCSPILKSASGFARICTALQKTSQPADIDPQS